jgi:acyl dehydratase
MKVTFAAVDVDKVYPEKEYVITEEKIRSYMAATGDLNPLYEEKRLVPPALAAVFTRWEALAEEEELLPGTIHAGQAFRYLQPLHWGDKVILRGRVVEKTEKRGLKFVVREVEARLENSGPAVISRITIILPE